MILALLGCLSQFKVWKIQSVDSIEKSARLTETILTSEHSYLKEEALRQLNTLPATDWPESIPSALLSCVSNSSEADHLRALCAQTLIKTDHVDTASTIVQAMDQCGDETRYWLLLSLESIAEDNPIATGQIADLQYDTDLFISAEAKRWIREQ